MDPMTQGQLKEWFLMLAAWGFLGSCIYVVAATFRRRQQNEMQKHMLEKFSSAQDFAAFVQSPAGQKYVMSFSEAVTNPRNTILNSLKTGFVLACVGIGFLAGTAGANGFTVRVGWICFLAGIGFLISAGVSYFLAKRMDKEDRE